MAILESIGLNSTIFLQFIIFLITYLFIHRLIFKPYNEAYSERLKRTEGYRGSAGDFLLKAQELQKKYENQAQRLNQQYKAHYEAVLKETRKERAYLLERAKEEARETLKESRARINREYQSALKEVEQEVPEVSKVIAIKLLGKELEA